MNHRFSVAKLTFPEADMARKVLAGKRGFVRLLQQDEVYIREYLSTESYESLLEVDGQV